MQGVVYSEFQPSSACGSPYQSLQISNWSGRGERGAAYSVSSCLIFNKLMEKIIIFILQQIL